MNKSKDSTLSRESLSGQTLLGIDYGEKVIGLAKFTVERDPFPLLLDRIVVPQTKDPIQSILNICEEEMVDRIVLGLPLYTDGTESEMTKRVRAFGTELLERWAGQYLHYQDEALSSFEAEERMKSDPRFDFRVDLKKIDALAASIIIEQFLQEQVNQ